MMFATSTFLLRILFSLITFCLHISIAQASSNCTDLFSGEVSAEQLLSSNPKVESIRLRIRADTSSSIKSKSEIAFKKLEALIEQVAVLRQNQSSKLVNQFLDLVEQEDQSIYHMTISDLIDSVSQQPNLELLSYNELLTLFRQKLYSILESRMSDETAELRSQALGVGTLQFALGELTAAQVKIELLGTEEGQISPTSLLGKYLAEIQQNFDRPGLVETRQFPTAPRRISVGVAKLAIESSSLAYQKYFSTNPNFLSHTHTDNQGTLYLHFMGKTISYAGSSQHDDSTDALNAMRVPLIILSTSEANRVNNYFTLGLIDRSRAKTPARLNNQATGESYVGVGGAYSCCSHWFGEMPFGDQLVPIYRFPGRVDTHGQILHRGKSRAELKQPGNFILNEYDSHGTTLIGNSSLIDRMTRIVWKSNNGPAQMWRVLGLIDQLDAAELTNPGYILYALMSRSTNDRVPVVLVPRETEQELQSNKTIKRNVSYY